MQRARLSRAAARSAMSQGVDPATGEPRSLTNAYIGLNPLQSARLGLLQLWDTKTKRSSSSKTNAKKGTYCHTHRSWNILEEQRIQEERLRRFRDDPLNQSGIFVDGKILPGGTDVDVDELLMQV